MRRRLGRVAAILLASALVFAGAGCATQDEWHPVTTEESQLLAMSRFENFDTGARDFTTNITVQGQDLQLRGWYDFVSHTGYAAAVGEGFAPQALLWSGDAVALREQPLGFDGLPALPVPSPADSGWSARWLDPSASALDALLLSFTLLSNDRPDNPLLLQQAGALWLGSELGDGSDGSEGGTLQLFAGPPSDEPLGPGDPAPTPETAAVRYLVDETGLMHRVELLLGGEWVTISFGGLGGSGADPGASPEPGQLAEVADLARTIFGEPNEQP